LQNATQRRTTPSYEIELNPENVHDFAAGSLLQDGDRGKEHGLALNAWVTALWHSALRRHGYERGLRREDGTVADRLIGNVVIVFEEKAVSDRYTVAQSPTIVPRSEPVSRETCREIDLIAAQ
jgi:hypothetical protein